MPMDPYFEAQLRQRRAQVVGGVRATVGAALRSLPARLRGHSPARSAGEALTLVHATGPATRAAEAPPKPEAPEAPAERAPLAEFSDATELVPAPADSVRPARTAPPRGTPEWERRNAWKWDIKLHGLVGINGPVLPTREFLIPVPGYPAVRVRLYLPATPAAGPLPAVIAFFGGSFHLGGIDYASVDHAFRRRTADSGVATLAVDYALAPDHRFPTPVEQGYAALDWFFRHAAELGIDPTRIAINGTSSGGNIAAATTLLNRARRDHPLALQVLEVPTTDLTGRHIDFWPLRRMGVPRPLAARELRKIRTRYLGDARLARTDLASPLRSRNLRGLPPAFILTAEYDALRGDGRDYADALRRAGVEASAVQYQGATHEAAMYTAELPLARRWHADIVTILRTLHGDSAAADTLPRD
ncbi:alpha/beta hydrolase [Mycetocola spongiae]|uniref:alpha/beta hydrolase n=1 Tax=Mycetocola spongiae TaxID=2859226 RepID=UPI001CF47EA4|nr:alpha/beta hydrolase [Mycetocola spongiae]